MRKLGTLCMAVFDIFEKNDISKIKSKLANFNHKKSPMNVIAGYDTAEIKENRDVWEIPDLSVVISQISKSASSQGLSSDLSLLQQSVKDAFFIGLENNELPFYTLALIIKIDASKFNAANILRDIDLIRYALTSYMRSFEGVTPSMYRPIVVYAPCITYLAARSTEEELRSLLDASQELFKLDDKIDDDSLNRKKALSSRFQSLDIISNRHHKWNLLSCICRYANLLCISGHLEQLGLGGLFTPFVITLTNDEHILSDTWFLDHHNLPGMVPSLSMVYREGGTISSFIFFIGNLLWLNYTKRKIEDTDGQISDLRKNIQETTLVGSVNVEELLVQWNKIGSAIGRSAGEIGRLARVVKPKISSYETSAGMSQPEIALIPSDSSLYLWLELTMQLDSDGRYVRTLTSQIMNRLSDMQTTLDNLAKEINQINTHLSTLSNTRMQKSMKWYAKSTWVFTMIITGLTAALLLYTLLPFPKP